MAASFAQWEKDPFFPAADDVQAAADRMESLRHLWIQARSDAPGELRRELQTALGTARWQLEELERAMRAYDELCSADEDAQSRHSHFVSAIASRISEAESSLREFSGRTGEGELAWIQLDAGERDELALFLSGATREQESPQVSFEEMGDDGRRTEGAGAGSGDCKISIPSEDSLPMLSGGQISHPNSRIVCLSGLISAMESTCRINWYRNGFQKWKGRNRCDAAESIRLCNHEFNQGVEACLERSEDCLGGCDDDCYDKQLNGWIGALHRQLQRSRYQIQYGRPMRFIVWVTLAILLIVFFATRAI